MSGLRDSKMSGRRPIQGFVRLAGLLLLAHAGVAAAQEITDCDVHDGLEPLCGVRGSEDLEVLPGGGQLIVSESRVQFDAAGHMHWLPSGLARLDLGTRQPQPLYPAPGSARPVDHWGDADCKGEIGAALSPHGLQLSRRADGRWQLLVVNHGGRESVEIFELLGRGARASLAWRGCVLAPPHAFLNDVAALADGGFVVTQYMDPRRTMAEQHADAEKGANTGVVLRWRPGHGLSPVPGTEAPLPNGIQVAHDGRSMFVSVRGEHGELRKYALPSGRLLASVRVTNPDNLSWAEDGRLLAAGLQPGADLTGCFVVMTHPCGAAFVVQAIDPDTLHAQAVFSHAGAPLGLATVAVQAGPDLYVGSAAGDRVLRVPAERWTH